MLVSGMESLASEPLSLPVGVVGAGAMGSGIAQVAAQAGHPVFLVDAVEGAALAAVERLRADLERLAAKGKVDPQEVPATIRRIVASGSWRMRATALSPATRRSASGSGLSP